ncbi:hypothetical protein [Micromonospora sp. DT31]|uniref:hypothetical protein n=1 Tax=Micromonospora sp. DT31 TaxID=3393434 RepID=UPI003CF56215
MPTSKKHWRVWQAVAACAVAAAWVVLGYGLRFSRPDPEGWDQFEAGGRFGLFFLIYLPFYLLTLAVAAVVVLALVSGRSPLPGTLTAVVLGVALFECWVALVGYPLFDAQPHLFASLTWSLVADGVALLALVGLWLTQLTRQTRPVEG